MTLAPPRLGVLAGFRTPAQKGLLSPDEVALVKESRLARVWMRALIDGPCSRVEADYLASRLVFSGHEYFRREAQRQGMTKVLRSIAVRGKAREACDGIWILDPSSSHHNALVLDFRNDQEPAVREPQRGDDPGWFDAPLITIQEFFLPESEWHPNKGAYQVLAIHGNRAYRLGQRITKEDAVALAARMGQKYGLPYQVA